MTIIYQKAYSYSLYNYNDTWYLTYLTGGPLESGVSIKLTPNEIERVKGDQSELEVLIKEFKSNSSLYEGREISPVVTSKGPPERR